jgi:potassium-transporting ATPase KdpC subunit
MKMFIRSILISVVLIILCGFIYPLIITGVSQLFFHKQANGSIIENNGKAVGSELLGQAFKDTRFFHGRLSANNNNTYTEEDKNPDKDGKTAYTGVSSGSSNLAPSNPDLAKRVQNDIDEFLKVHQGVKKEDIPQDLLTSSASGLDPNISPEAAKIQVPSISKATGINNSDLEKLISKYTESRTLGILGETRVNILKLNLEIAQILKL